MKKRVLSLLMALTLCLTTLPTAVFADVTENGEGSGGTHYVAESGGTQYETVQEILDNMEEGEITLLDSVTEDLTVYAATTIHMNGHSITGNIDATDSLTLNGGTVDGTVKVYGGTLNMTAPAEAEAAITGGLNVVSGSAFVSGAQVGVKGTLYFDGTDMLIFGAVKAVELDSAAEPAAKTLYGSATVNGDTAAEAGFDTDTYKVGGEIAKKLTNKQVGSTTPAAPSLTLTETSKSLTAGKTAVFTANYTGTDTLNAYVQGSAVNGYFTISQKNNGDGTYTVSVKIDEETPGGTYTLFVHELGNTSVQASATITVTGLPDAAEVNGKQYKSLPAALNAAQNGDTVKLLADHVTDADALNALGEDFTFEQYASIVPVVTKTLTLDLNHKTVDYLEVGFTETNEETQKKETLATGNLTVTGEGAYGRISNLMFMAGALDIRSGEIGGSEGAGLVCDVNSGTATISNGTVYGLTVSEGASVTVKGGSNHAGEWVVASSATLNITDGTFGDVQFTHNGTIAISGGTFKSIKSYIAEELQPLMSLLDTQKVHAFYKDNAVQDGNATELADVTVKEHTHTMVDNKCACGFSCTHKGTDGTSAIDKDGKCAVCGTQFAAGIGETYYTDVPSALDAAADGQTITLLANGTLPYGIYASKTLTLDLNGHSLSGHSLNVGGSTATGQALTGNLTVIDSSGGNGAVGVTVREGGTLVFDPKNDHTTLLQLEVWGGTVELYGGKISRSGLRLNNGITLGNLLPGQAGLAYYRGDTQLTLEEAASQTCDLVVKSCSHGGKNGFDENATACPDCNAPAVAETDLNGSEGVRLRRRFANLQTALDADRDGGATLQLLTDVTGDYTIDGTQDTGLNLNGHCIKGTVTVKAAVGNNTTTFSNTQNNTTAGIDAVVAYKGAKLAGSDYSAVIGKLTLADTTEWKDILQQLAHIGFRVTNTDGTHTWYAPDDVEGSQLNNVIINYDKAAPDWSGNESGIRIKSTWWNKILSSVPFGLYKGSSLDVYAKANDSQSGVAEYYYYIDNSGSTTTLTAEELSNKSFTKVAADKNGTTKLTEITSDNNYVIYAYAVDAAGNRSAYISSDGVVLDNTAPKLTNVSTPAKSNGTLSDTSATITFTGSEAGTYYYILKENGEPAPTVMSDFAAKTAGDKVDTWTAKEGVSTGTLTADEANTIKFTGLKADTSYVLYLAATDAAGNASVAESAGADGDSGVVSVSFTTTKTTPYVKTAPVLSGTYGNTVSAMLEKADMTKASVTAGPSSDTKIEGTWTSAFEDADKLPTVGTSEKYTLVFTPTGSDADTYDSVTCEVIPEVSKKQITVVIADKEKFYGEANPALTWSLATGDAYADNVLVAGDTEEALGISLSTTAKDNSNVGTYAITGLSDSANYEVSFSGSGSDGKSGVMTVKQAAKAPNMPEAAMAPAHSTKKVGDITLPDGWSWQEADKDTVLADGVAVTATAVYIGADKGNYETESVSITITRRECDHTHTEIRNQREATCTQTGYAGDTYCTDCDKLMSTGKELAALGHDYKATVTKQPTTTEEGVRTYTCTRCGHSYTESIAKLTSPSPQPTATPSGKPETPSPQPKGTNLKDDTGAAYKVTSANGKTPAVQYLAPKSGTKGTVTVPSEVTIDGVTYKVTSIAGNAFKGTKKIKKIVIGSNITSIGKNAFAGCTSLTSITIGKNVTKIGKNAFTGCKKLKSITIKTKKLTTKTVKKGAFNGISKKVVVKVPKSKYKTYKKLLPAKGLKKAAKIRK